MRIVAAILLMASALASTPKPVSAPYPLPTLPRLVLWAWEHPENLSYLDPDRTAVAFLAGTITAGAGCEPRHQPFHVPPSTPLIVTVRIESDNSSLLDSPLPAPEQAVECALSFFRMPGAKALQIDFDARLSERAWYRRFLAELRRRLAANVPLTITALASWCEQDGWIRGLPITEAVPMLFRMGPGEVWNRRDFDVPLCRSSVGLATDELPTGIPPNRRIYLFHPGRWTQDAYHAAWKAARSFQ